MIAGNYNLPVESIPHCPLSGAGVHSWILSTANRCWAMGMSRAEAVRFIRERMTRAPSPANEVEAAVAKAYSNRKQSSNSRTFYFSAGCAPIPISEIKFDPLKLADSASRITQSRNWRHWLWERSPKRPETQNAFSFLKNLYCEGEHVHIFDAIQTKVPLQTLTISNPLDCRVPSLIRTGGQHGSGIWFLVNPVDNKWQNTGELDKLGRPILSCRNWQSITSLRYAVLESDLAPFDLWLAFIVQLPLRIAAIYTSAGRSIHTLIQLDAATKGGWDGIITPLKRPLKVLGGDVGCLSAVRLSRLPACSRPEKNGFQRLLYLAPNPPLARLLDLPIIQTRAETLARWRRVDPRWNSNMEAAL
jgi:hypothetical protein